MNAVVAGSSELVSQPLPSAGPKDSQHALESKVTRSDDVLDHSVSTTMEPHCADEEKMAITRFSLASPDQDYGGAPLGADGELAELHRRTEFRELRSHNYVAPPNVGACFVNTRLLRGSLQI